MGRTAALGFALLGAADFAKRLREDYEFKGRLVRELGLKPQ